jgi:hypothetical protein
MSQPIVDTTRRKPCDVLIAGGGMAGVAAAIASARNGGCYGIPFRALQPTGLENLLIAGRMMSVDLVAHNSTRNTVCCLACGQAAGAAAALAARKNVSLSQLDAGELRDILESSGVLLKPRPYPLESMG